MTVVKPDPDRAPRGPARVAPRPAARAARNNDGGAGVGRRRSRSEVVRRPAAENSDPRPCSHVARLESEGYPAQRADQCIRTDSICETGMMAAEAFPGDCEHGPRGFPSDIIQLIRTSSTNSESSGFSRRGKQKVGNGGKFLTVANIMANALLFGRADSVVNYKTNKNILRLCLAKLMLCLVVHFAVER